MQLKSTINNLTSHHALHLVNVIAGVGLGVAVASFIPTPISSDISHSVVIHDRDHKSAAPLFESINQRLKYQQVASSYAHTLTVGGAIAKELNINPHLIQALMIKESQAGKASSLVGSINGGVGNRSYGVMQLKVEAARSVFSRHPSLVKKYFKSRQYKSIVDEEIIVLLMTNHEANIRIGCYHLLTYYNILGDWNASIVAYNVGIGNYYKLEHPELHPYLLHVIDIMNSTVADFNITNNYS